MAIKVSENGRLFTLQTKDSSYQMFADDKNVLLHLYYGEKIGEENLSGLIFCTDMGFAGNPEEAGSDRTYSLDTLPQEVPSSGVGDYRDDMVRIRQVDGSCAADFRFDSYEILDHSYAVPGMPALYDTEEEKGETLVITMKEKASGVVLKLFYGVFENENVITRAARLENHGETAIELEKMLSFSMDLMYENYEMIYFSGRHAMERTAERIPVQRAKVEIGSIRGTSSHHYNSAVILCEEGADETHGSCIGACLVYSGNFVAAAQKDQKNQTRFQMGIHPANFCFHLEKGKVFDTPQVILSYSGSGLTKLSQQYHEIIREHICRGAYKHAERPILINNWEATYFDFDTDKLLDIAREAKKDGIEMLVMDDGWFGKRNKDDSSLGDWVVNEEKIKGGLKNLVDKVNEIGLEFGIWFEPEMISPDSDLYREHPEWAIQIPGREATEIRCQYVLDLSRPEVQDYAYECVAKILRSANIKYVKWDMNRQLSDLGSTYLDKDSQQELFHRYVLGMYAMQERLIQEFPDLLLENCSGGGARFDPGMLYYSPQIWCSDDTDAIERLEIQEGTALIYPLCSMGAHVSVCPNHTVGRVTPFTTRGHVALAGTFGYELDITKLPEEERKLIPEQTAMYHKYHELIREGEYYRILSSRENHRSDCWAVASEDKSEVLVTYVQVLAQANMPSRKVRLRGFDPAKKYRLEGTDEVYSGEMLMNAGFRMKDFWGDFVSRLYHFVAVD